MKTTTRDIIYQGVWLGIGKVYNIRVENGYTTIIVKPGESIQQRSIETKEKFASQLRGDNA
jgi:hypothetical protein